MDIENNVKNSRKIILTPALSQRRNVLNEPTANISPEGAQANEVIGKSCNRLLYSCLPYISQTYNKFSMFNQFVKLCYSHSSALKK